MSTVMSISPRISSAVAHRACCPSGLEPYVNDELTVVCGTSLALLTIAPCHALGDCCTPAQRVLRTLPGIPIGTGVDGFYDVLSLGALLNREYTLGQNTRCSRSFSQRVSCTTQRMRGRRLGLLGCSVADTCSLVPPNQLACRDV